MPNLYVAGARRKKRVFRDETEWNLYDAAVILEIDTDSGDVRTCVEYNCPAELRPYDSPSTIFKSSSVSGGTLYACTKTEILTFNLPDFQTTSHISLPCFHDVHHVTQASDGNLLVANTGLDMVVKINSKGEILSEWCVVDEPLWSRFSRAVDYRKIETTKPHRSHPNFVFELNRQAWVTRFHQRDAICLDDPTKRIDIGVEAPHDGVVHRDQILFTTVDARIAIADASSLKVNRIVDLKQINGGNALLGWCRGLLPADESTMWVGFSRIRNTWHKENVRWVKGVFREGMSHKPTHIGLYDLSKQRCLQEFDLEAHGMHVIFSILPAALHKNGFSEGIAAPMTKTAVQPTRMSGVT